VALNIRMFIIHKLYDTIYECRDGKDILDSLDEAISFYIGAGQDQGDMNAGYLLYSLAESMGYHFGQMNGQSIVNIQMLSFFS